MKKIILCIGVLLSLGCTDKSDDKKFYDILDTYKNILITREQFQDTAVANPKILKILESKGYTEPSFRKELFELISKDKEKYTLLLDSLKKSLKNEYIIEKAKYDSLKSYSDSLSKAEDSLKLGD